MTSRSSGVEIGVIGAGLSGLATGVLLADIGYSVHVFEARDCPGGRIQSVTDRTGRYLADLGPTWVWPAFQPTITRWLEKLDLTTFEQFELGETLLDQGPDHPVESRLLSTGQSGHQRLLGGPQAMIDRLRARLPACSLRTGSPVVEVDLVGDRIALKVSGEVSPGAFTVDHLIVALPPRLALMGIAWRPALPQALSQALGGMPTWMAQHAKAVAFFDRAFWRERGRSGRILSRVGPLVEVHDHSGPDGEPAALFGFVGWPSDVRNKLGGDLELHVRDQLQRCLGQAGDVPTSVHIKDWAKDPLVAVHRDLADPIDHPKPGPAIIREAQFGGRLWFAGSETAEQSPGLIEGALVAAEQAVARLTARTGS
ncbi:MAG: FAD-dependent oxidoreductase [Pseudomonadota bacterium]